MTDRPTRRDLLRPVQLLAFAFFSALFAGIVTLVTMGFFQTAAGEQRQQILIVAAIAAGIAFIAVLLMLSLLLLAVDPAQVSRGVDRPVLLPEPGPADVARSEAAPGPAGDGAGTSGGAPAADPDAGR
jgi:Na+/melibiose symporter-like transporter